MTEDDMQLKLLEALIATWLQTMSPIEIRNDLEKIQLLKDARALVVEGAPSPMVRQVYQEVFLRDLWANGNDAGRTA